MSDVTHSTSVCTDIVEQRFPFFPFLCPKSVSQGRSAPLTRDSSSVHRNPIRNFRHTLLVSASPLPHRTCEVHSSSQDPLQTFFHSDSVFISLSRPRLDGESSFVNLITKFP